MVAPQLDHRLHRSQSHTLTSFSGPCHPIPLHTDGKISNSGFQLESTERLLQIIWCWYRPHSHPIHDIKELISIITNQTVFQSSCQEITL
uniref:Uncharacterized protein n=1 Tax=Knipowitschia caucasica TaxID=637954 RepID=A0AAV2L794_KNICA